MRLGVEEAPNTDHDLLYPNPVNDVLHVNQGDVQSLNIYDETGKLIMMATVTEPSLIINVADWTGGVYFAKAISGDGVMRVARFMKR